jgi:hypothetical protein
MADNTDITTHGALDRAVLDTIAVKEDGTFALDTFSKMWQFATLMSLMGVAVRPHCRGNRAVCFALVRQAMRWGIDPIEVANKSYVTVSKHGVETLAYESQLVHAVIEKLAPLNNRLRVRYEGNRDDRVCIIYGTLAGETEPHEWKSPPLNTAKTGRKSPLWETKTDLALFYDTVRDWARAWCPDVTMGLYTQEEMMEAASAPALVVNPLGPDPDNDHGEKPKRGWPKGRPRKVAAIGPSSDGVAFPTTVAMDSEIDDDNDSVADNNAIDILTEKIKHHIASGDPADLEAEFAAIDARRPALDK